MKRRTAFMLALIMVLCVVLSACGEAKPAKEPVTKEALIGGYKTKTEQAKGISYTIAMDAKLGVSVLGQAQNMEMAAELKVETDAEAAHMTGSTSVNANGQNQKETMDIYSIKSGDGFDVYTKTGDNWYKSHANVSIDGNVQAVLSIQDPANMTMTEAETEYIVEGSVPLAEAFDAVKNYIGGLDDLNSIGMDLDSMDLKGVDPAKITYHFDKDSEEITAVDMDLSDSMKSLMDQLVKQLSGLGQQMGGSDSLDLSSFISLSVEKFVVSMKDIELDKEVKIELPDAAKNASEMPVIDGGTATTMEDFYVEEMKISLPSDYEQTDAEGYTAAFFDDYTAVLVIREDKADLENYAENMDEYVQLVMSANESRGFSDPVYEKGRPTFEYDYTASDGTYTYYTTLYESDIAFWILQFASPKEVYEAFKPVFVQLADTVVFAH